ncbi:protein panoramix [Drosophila biarmipes]|uniref:protein panoramix n=1 Tax=Drosophila biarmipes TaxID=125945 RepID=UPI0007E5D762|nr:protein panoramix [Drosophila biarmipes]
MEAVIKQEVKIENEVEAAINEDDATPLRESTGQTPPHAFAAAVPMSGCGWDSDPEDEGRGPRSAPPTPGAHLQAPRTPGAHLEAPLGAIVPKAEPVIKEEADNQVLDGLLADPFDIDPPAALPASTSPAGVKPHVKLEPVEVEQGSCTRDGLPSLFTRRDNLDDMDLCSLEASKKLVPHEGQGTPTFSGLQEDPLTESELIARQREILKELGEHDIKDVGKENSEGNGREKKKKKKHKKDRSHRSNKDQDEPRKRKRSNSSENEGAKEKHRGDRHGRKHRIKTEKPDEELDYVPVRPDEKSIRTVKFSDLSERPLPPAELNTSNLSKADKRNLAVARAELVLELFEKKVNKEVAEEFHMVDTICKLPVNDSFRNQGCFENPSPICNNMNVVYEFNSTPGTRIDLAKWGLEGVPKATGKLLRLLGIDVARLKQIQSTTKPSQRILKLKKEKLEQGLAPTEEVDTATLYKNAATQTERRTATRDSGTQVRLESQLKGAFWQDPKFDPMDLTQHQSNVMFALQEIYKTLPSSAVAVNLYRALQPALAIARAAAQQQ